MADGFCLFLDMEKKIILADLFYLPSLEFFTAIHGADLLVLEDRDTYQKQSYRNRSQIRLANKVETLSVPVLEGNKKVHYTEVNIDYSQKWKNVHLRGIQSSYGKAPFFEYYFPYFEQVFHRNIDKLYEFNLELLTVCLKLMRVKTQVTLASQVDESTSCEDIRGIIVTKESYKHREIYHPQPYTQLFGLDFVSNLSVIDLLFCEGPHANEVLAQSKKNK